jgi:hypothetical protein
MSGARPSRFGVTIDGQSSRTLALPRQPQTIAELAAVALSGGEQRASFFADRPQCTTLLAGDEYGGVKSLWVDFCFSTVTAMAFLDESSRWRE